MSSNFFSQLTVTFEAGETIYKQGEHGHSMFIITEGRVALLKEKSGKKEVISDLGKGDFFGELSILESIPRPHTAKVVNSASVVVIHRNTFLKMLKANMEIAIRLLQKLSAKLRNREEKIDVLVSQLAHVQDKAEETLAITAPAEKVQIAGQLVALGSKRVFQIDADQNLVGRFDPVTGIKPEVDLTHEDENRSVSRRHAIIYRRENEFFVREELGVLNGTFVNGQKVAQNDIGMKLVDKDTINFGMLAFRFERMEKA
ncbi:MAG: hypothetical protein CSA81_01805 [Acidobacteria bacterium]|nr:MAG: hypothetical protein CSA81_01805 [Acidobacteriota bacterium]